MSRSRKRKKAPRHLQMSLVLLALAALVLLAYLIIIHLWLLAALVGICALIGGGVAVLLAQRHTRQRAMWRERIKTLNDLIRLTPTQFELITVELLRTQGFRHVRHTGGGGDLAADIICYTPQGQRAVVQCKRYAPQHHVGSPDIQKFIGMVRVHHHAEVGIFVTTSTYTHPARTLAKQHNFMLLDGPYLEGLVQQFLLQQQQQVPAPV
ncbi:MAG TPA: restriction endonuclease [Ktedonobacterales bacterium]